MIAGVGCDIIEIERIENLLEKDGFLKRCFTASEIEYFEKRKWNAQSVAAGFAAKAAVSKALGTGISGFSMKDIEILHDEKGKPNAVLHSGAAELADKLSAKVFVSMSHTDKLAMAYAVLDS